MHAAALLVLLLTPALAQNPPLPDRDVFLEEVRRRLSTDDERRRDYAYQESRRDWTLDAQGRVTEENVHVYEHYPGFPGEGRWRRLLSENGTPVPAEKLQKEDREREKKALEYARKLERQTEEDRQARARDRDKDRRKNQAAIDDAFLVYDIRMLRREMVDDHATIAFSLTPRPASRPRTREGKMLKHFAGTAWISESDHELVRLEVEVIDTVSLGPRALARIHDGTRMRFDRRKVNGEVWLPASAGYTVSGRLALFKRIRAGAASEFSSYRKFSVDTEAVYGKPKPGDRPESPR
jgi:hypothetical protein